MDKNRVAAIDIGSRAIRMTIAEVVNDKIEILEEVSLSVRLGKDSFDKGRILRPTIDESIQILRKYKNLCEEYKVDRIRAVATTAVREATNFDIFLDNILTNTGISVEILSITKETELIYKAISEKIKNNKSFKKENYHSIVEIGSGSVEISIFKDEFIIFSRTLPLGALKMKQIFSKATNIEENFFNYLKVMVEHELRNLKREIPVSSVEFFHGISSELEHIFLLINKKENSPDIKYIEVEDLRNICNKMQGYIEEELIHKLDVPYDMSETFYPISLMFLKIADFFKCSKIYIPDISLRDGLLYDMISKKDNNFFNYLEKQLEISSINIGRSFNFDENHSLKVKELALKLFDKTKFLHQLGEIERCYLLVASILHDIGSAISNSSHHKHSLYIIKTKNFFYLNENEVKIIANVARYHRRSIPKNTHQDYMELSNRDRMIVMKLASILRIADSLDNTHLQLVSDIDLIKENDQLYLITYVNDQIFAELYSFKYKRDLFEMFFGVNIKLRIKKIKNGDS